MQQVDLLLTLRNISTSPLSFTNCSTDAWLPVQHRIRYKIAHLTSKVFMECLLHISPILSFSTILLEHISQNLLKRPVMYYTATYGKRSFSEAASTVECSAGRTAQNNISQHVQEGIKDSSF